MKREAIRVLIIDGQGGGMGRGLVEAVKKRWPALHLRAVGTNSLATAVHGHLETSANLRSV